MDEIILLLNGKPLAKSSTVLKLSPYLDADGLLRVEGRLQHSSIPEHEKHPILVPQPSSHSYSTSTSLP